ncbi:MAG: sulfurtransferase complex subunit TusD [Gammaproteobacteria bacterium]|nr:sulfurtransferase complex subunit TusD [Pseudomonadales bacterium]MCP5346201.1 sulfurtransferase complex subunit TusD [Pseudomonadales bacterium]
MKFSIVIHSAPYASEGASSALRFCQAVLAEGHEIYRLFFFRDGVHNLTRLAVVAQDETSLQDAWEELIREHRLDAVACVTSALKRGIIDSQEANRYDKAASNLSELVSISGLGQLVDAVQNSDRVLNFG